MNKSRRLHRAATAPSYSRYWWSRALQAVVLGGAVALIVLGTLIHSEAAVPESTYAPLAAAWCALLVFWCVATALAEHPRVTIGWTEIAIAALVGWHTIAALVSLGEVNGRQALNALWLVVSYGIAAILFRQTLRAAVQVRGLVVVMLWLATLLASFGLYQYFYSQPVLRARYAANPEAVLAESGFPLEKSSPQRTLFENRLTSVEPLGTFALTNSLAGFLSPWLIAALAIALPLLGKPDARRTLWAMLAIALVLAACLVLTKSRTAFLATLGGVALVGLYGRERGWKLDWRLPAFAAGIATVLTLLAIYFGGLDLQVMSEAPKSVLYRLEYWRATASMIGDHLFLGCGPGNFQQAYTAYKLPEASETVADPHNFLLELWATAGTPALVFTLLGVLAFTIDMIGLATRHAQAPQDGTSAGAGVLFGGAACGLFAALPLAILVGYPLEIFWPETTALPVVWLLGAPLLALFWFLFPRWIAAGEISLPALIVPQIVLLINLSAAGAITFPGVIGTLLVLAPLTLATVVLNPASLATPIPPKSIVSRVLLHLASLFPRDTALSRSASVLLTCLALAISIACLSSEYYPTLFSRQMVAKSLDAVKAGDAASAEKLLTEAAAADPRWPEPSRHLADLRLTRWLANPTEAEWTAFKAAANDFTTRDPKHHAAWWSRANWYLMAWRQGQRPADLSQAVQAYGKASECYPHRALYHAQLAWALHLADDRDSAYEEARRAQELDDQMPHREQKLNQQKLFDPDPTSQPSLAGHTAEQIVDELRKAGEEK